MGTGRSTVAPACRLDMRTIIRELFETVILAMLIYLALQFSVQNYRVQGSSMRPTLEEGEYVLVNKLVYALPFHPPERGEIIIFRFPGDLSRDFVKRVVGRPGDTVEIRQGRVYVNGEPQDEPYVTRLGSSTKRTLTVPEDTYYVLGDNRRASNDSRDWGPVPAENIIGRAWVSFWPLNRWHALLAAVPDLR